MPSQAGLGSLFRVVVQVPCCRSSAAPSLLQPAEQQGTASGHCSVAQAWCRAFKGLDCVVNSCALPGPSRCFAEPAPRAKSLGQSVQGMLLSPFMAAASLAAAVTPGGSKDRGKEQEKGKENGEASACAAAAAEEGAANGALADATSGEQSVRGQRGGLLGGLMRSTSLHQLALLGAGGGSQNQSRSRLRERRGRLERQSSRRSVGGRSRRSRRGGYASDSESGEAAPAWPRGCVAAASWAIFSPT